MVASLTADFPDEKETLIQKAQEIFLAQGPVAAADHLVRKLFKDIKYGDRYPYYFHLSTVASSINDPEVKAAALMHDLLEDIEGWTKEDLYRVGFSKRTVDAVIAVSKKPEGEAYYDAMDRVSLNPDAVLIKLSDLKMNINPAHLGTIPNAYDLERTQKYWLAINYLEDVQRGATPPASFGQWVEKNADRLVYAPEDKAIIEKLVAKHYTGATPQPEAAPAPAA